MLDLSAAALLLSARTGTLIGERRLFWWADSPFNALLTTVTSASGIA